MATSAENKRIVRSLRRKAEAISFLNELMAGAGYSLEDPNVPPWFEVEKIHEVSRSTYIYHAESNQVKWSDGVKFMFAIDRQPFQFFWKMDDCFFGRQLTEEETFYFCKLTDVKRYT